jgi:acetolactate synthase-1/2/3 large subunit
VFFSGPSQRRLPPRHPLNGQAVGSLLALGPQGPDVVLLLGAPMGLFTAGTAAILPDAKVIEVEADAAEIGRLRPVDVAVEGDPGGFVRALLADTEPWPDRKDWADKATWAHRMVASTFSEAPTSVDGRIHPYHAAREALSALEPGAIVVQDGGEAQLWAGTAGTAAEPSIVLGLGYQGHLGIGIGFSIGAHYADPNRQILLITGDGAVGFHIQEFDTMVRHGVPVVVVVFANDTWGMSIHGQDAVYGAGHDMVSRLTPTAYADVVVAFGGHGERVDDPSEVKAAVRRAFASGKPSIVNVVVSNEVVHPMTIAMLGDLTATDEIVIPYYKNLSR